MHYQVSLEILFRARALEMKSLSRLFNLSQMTILTLAVLLLNKLQLKRFVLFEVFPPFIHSYCFSTLLIILVIFIGGFFR